MLCPGTAIGIGSGAAGAGNTVLKGYRCDTGDTDRCRDDRRRCCETRSARSPLPSSCSGFCIPGRGRGRDSGRRNGSRG